MKVGRTDQSLSGGFVSLSSLSTPTPVAAASAESGFKVESMGPGEVRGNRLTGLGTRFLIGDSSELSIHSHAILLGAQTIRCSSIRKVGND